MSGKVKKMSSKNTYLTKLKSYLKTEIARVYLTSDGKQFFDEYLAVIHESTLDKQREINRRWNKMKTKIAEIVCEILKEKQWGIFFKNEPMQSLPVQDNTALYKINEVNKDELVDAIEQAIEERMSEWQNHQAQEKENQTDNGLSSGTNQTLIDTD
tara:strand:+ start:1559 stop:2026 length:468 start_codon:yes stop_codon:yes gene_type:complete